MRTSSDWNSWAFLFDDLFDEGHLSNDLDAAVNEIARTREIMEGTAPRYTADSGHPIRYAFQTLCDRVKQSPEGFFVGKPSSERFYKRWMWAHELYWEGLVAQVRTNVEGRSYTRSPEEYLAMRRSLGFKLAGEGRMLLEFADRLDATGQTTVTVTAAVAWASEPTEASANHRHRELVIFPV